MLLVFHAFLKVVPHDDLLMLLLPGLGVTCRLVDLLHVLDDALIVQLFLNFQLLLQMLFCLLIVKIGFLEFLRNVEGALRSALINFGKHVCHTTGTGRNFLQQMSFLIGWAATLVPVVILFLPIVRLLKPPLLVLIILVVKQSIHSSVLTI